MRKVYQFWIGSTLVLALATLVSCEGPAGPAGPAGQDGNVTCLECHATDVIETKEAEFTLSAHSSGAIAVDYAGGRASCARCHSHEGFVQYANTGSVLGDITNPSAWECKTCHGLHKTFETDDFALRLADPVVANFDETVTMDLNGNSNLCANCHQSRTAEPNVASPGTEFRISSTHYGPHHGPQANVLYGAGFAEIPGSIAYPEAGSGNHLSQASCVGCHMYDQTDATGGHSFWPNKAACNSCHNGTELTDDFNYGGVQTEVQEKLDQLRDKLIELGVVEFVEADGAYEPVVGTYPMVQAQAYFNWIGLVEDRSLGAHNPKYVRALLTNTLAALN